MAAFSPLKKGDKVRNKRDHKDIAIVMEVQFNIVPGFGVGYRILIMQDGLRRWEPGSMWEVIKEEGEHGQQSSN